MLRFRWLESNGVNHVDLVSAIGCVATKPGWGIVSEAVLNNFAVLYVERPNFPESEYLIKALRDIVNCREVRRLASVWVRHVCREPVLCISGACPSVLLPCSRPQVAVKDVVDVTPALFAAGDTLLARAGSWRIEEPTGAELAADIIVAVAEGRYKGLLRERPTRGMTD
jgi:hypothetical protein